MFGPCIRSALLSTRSFGSSFVGPSALCWGAAILYVVSGVGGLCCPPMWGRMVGAVSRARGGGDGLLKHVEHVGNRSMTVRTSLRNGPRYVTLLRRVTTLGKTMGNLVGRILRRRVERRLKTRSVARRRHRRRVRSILSVLGACLG